VSDLRDKLLSAFQVEHKEHLEGMRAILSRVEREGASLTGADLDEVFRRAHSLKAAARVCDFQSIDKLGQRLETLFSQVRKGTLHLSRDVLDAVKVVLNAIEDWALGMAENRNPAEPTHALEAVERILSREPARQVPSAEASALAPKLLAAFQVEHKEHLEGIRAILAEVEQGGAVQGANIDEAFRRAHSLKGAARIAELRAAETLAHRLETLFARVREGALPLDEPVFRVIHRGLDAIEDAAACLVDKRSPPDAAAVLDAIERILRENSGAPPAPAPTVAPSEAPPPLGPHVPAAETVRVSAENLDRLLRSTGQLLTENQRQNLVARELGRLSRQIHDMEKEWEAVRSVAAGPFRQLAATPGLARVAQYVNHIEHQVKVLSRQARALRLLHQRSAWTLQLLGGQLQQDVRRVRMVAAESVFQGFRKMVRDLARQEGKEVEFRVSGFDLEADRMVLQALKDPLMHILCNAVSHGIEPPGERIDKEKNPVGRVTLQMETVGNRLTIRVEDDGRGIDPRFVAEAAVQRGFLTESEAEAAAPADLVRLIFQPGFSTAREVTGLAGRGMGLSVVYEAVTRLQGEVELRRKEGPGTALLLSVPLSVSTQRLLLVSCQGQTFALPIHGIERLLRIQFQDVETVEGRPMLLDHGQPIALLSLASLLDMGEADVTVADDVFCVMIVRSGTRRVALAVDAFLEERDSLIKALDEPAAQLTKLAGGILLDDGSVALVLNLAEVLKTARPSDRAPALKKVEPAPQKKRSTVLVVDDSLTTRTLEKSILEAHGYDVQIAIDGIEALTRLQAEPVDLVITDLQMSRLDGFGLLEQMKKDQRLARVPVIVVTSMDRREDQERGLALGADAYIVKRKFDHQDLLDTIRQII
jgi:two-component system chemotaxis sensor kinase CheA